MRHAAVVVASLAMWVALPACAAAHERPTTREQEVPGAAPPGAWYEVQQGDTLYDIARRHALGVDDIAEVNGIAVDAPLARGQLLFLPGAERPPSRAPERAAAVVDADPPPAAGSAPLAWPLDEGVLLRSYTAEGPVPHEGVMFAAPDGTPVRAAADGEVVHVGEEGSWGNMVIVQHAGDLVTIYAHVAASEVKPGDRVKRGQVIARVGTSGRAESPQLHFQVRSGRTPVDPLAYLPAP